MSVLKNLQPEKVFYYFEEISKIPHGSFNTKPISDYLVSFAKEHGLKYYQDHADNVVIYKPATAGYEDAPVTILQGHTDMVCEKTADSSHDFMTDALELCVDGDVVSAKGTTLGGDNGVAVAYTLAILDSDTIEHPALEAVFTSNEEVGLLGADALDANVLKGTVMLNLDSEVEGVFTVGCAGGMTGKSMIPLNYWEADGLRVDISISGLNGGHSGIDINKSRGNATILLGRFLYELEKENDYMLMEINGGLKDNAIPRMASATIVVAKEDAAAVVAAAQTFEEALIQEYAGSDAGVKVNAVPKSSGTFKVMDMASKMRTILFLRNVPNGVQKMSGQIEGLVETSTNLGTLVTEDSMLKASSSVRSSLPSAKREVGDRICFLTEFLGGEYEESGDYPGWAYDADSKIRPLMVSIYEKMYGKTPVIEAIHAGLECGVFVEKMQKVDCISFGPSLTSIHTVEEHFSISSVQRTWEYILNILKEMKNY